MEKNKNDSRDIREVDQIVFGIYSADEIRKLSVCKIDSSKIGGLEKNLYGTVYDPRMGTIENGKQCETCGEGSSPWTCPGHFGHIELNECIVHPLYFKRVVDFLRCFCIKCFKLLMTNDQIVLSGINRSTGVKRFTRILENLTKIDMCYDCKQPQPDIKYTATDNTIAMVYKNKGKDKTKISVPLQVDEIKNIFDNISNDDVRLLGFNPDLMHPSNLIITVFPVLPISARPYIICDGNICDDDLTIQIIEIIKANNHLKAEDGIPVNDTKRQKYIQSVKFRISTFYNNSGGRAKHSTNGRAIKGLKERLTGKEGILRFNLMGKRCFLLGTKILLWNGNTKNVEDIKVGDMLIGNDGEKRNVIKLCNGTDQMYKIKQSRCEDYIVNSQHILSFKINVSKKAYWVDGVRCWVYTWVDGPTLKLKTKKVNIIKRTKDEAHLVMQSFIDSLDKNDTVNISVEDYLKLSDKAKKLLYGYIIEKPVNWEYKKVSIDPYILGMWLGDGSQRGRGFTSNDVELVDHWKTWAEANQMEITLYKDGSGIQYGIKNKAGCKGTNPFAQHLRDLELSEVKFIPRQYMFNSKEVRLAVLAGLIDTDGSVESGGVVICITQSYGHEQILLDAQFVARSLGFRASLADKKTTWTHKGEKKHGKALVLTISGYGLENIPTILKRKKCRSPLIGGTNWNKITVEPHGVGEFYGFEIDNNNLFVLPDFTVVHNCEQSGRTVIGPDPTLRLGQVAVPVQMATNLTVPVQVTDYNIGYLNDIVNNGRANFVIKKDIGTRINLEHKLSYRGTLLEQGDIILRTDPHTNETTEIVVNNGKDVLKWGDRLKRGGEYISEIQYPEKRQYSLSVGDVVERHLMDGDILMLNRQPTLHIGSMLGMEVVVKPPAKTLRFNLAICKSFNSDFDGDEMNIHVPQTVESQTELRLLSAAKHNIISPQSSNPNFCIVQDSLLGAYRMTLGIQVVRKDQFFDIALKLEFGVDKILKKIQHIRRVLKEKGKKIQCFNGKGLVSLLFQDDFYYENKNNGDPNEPVLKIYKGVLYEGTLNKSVIGATSHSLIKIINKEYGPDEASLFVDGVQFLSNNWLMLAGFSIGLEDCLVQGEEQTNKINDVIDRCYIEAEGVKSTTSHLGIREIRISAALNKAKDIGLKIAKDSLNPANNFLSTVRSGSKGDYFNICQITGLLGQQNLAGKRVIPVLNNGQRTLSHYPMKITDPKMEYESKGFIGSSFIKGLNPKQFFFHACSGRQGVSDTSMNTATSGYIQRRITKLTEDIKVQNDETVRDMLGSIYQISYGDDGIDPKTTVRVGQTNEICDIAGIVTKLNNL